MITFDGYSTIYYVDIDVNIVGITARTLVFLIHSFVELLDQLSERNYLRSFK